MTTPLLEAAPQLVDSETGARAWLFDEVATVLSQAAGPMTAAYARFLAGPVDAEVRRRWVSAGRKVRFIHDWRACVSYEPESRDIILAWAKACLPFAGSVTVQLSPEASVFVRIAFNTGVGALRLLRMPVESVDDLGPILHELSAFTPR